MNSVGVIVKLDIVVVGAFAVSSSDDADLTSASTFYKVSDLNHGFSSFVSCDV